MNKLEMQAEALQRAQEGASVTNYPAIFAGFTAMGIPESQIEPRVNVLTFHAWKAKGRSVMKGQHGVKVTTFVPVEDKDTGEVVGRRASTAVVFHVSQTELTADAEARWAAAREARGNGQGGSSSPRRGGYRGYRRGGWRSAGYHAEQRHAEQRREQVIRDPGEDAADRWQETHGDRWIES